MQYVLGPPLKGSTDVLLLKANNFLTEKEKHINTNLHNQVSF